MAVYFDQIYDGEMPLTLPCKALRKEKPVRV